MSKAVVNISEQVLGGYNLSTHLGKIQQLRLLDKMAISCSVLILISYFLKIFYLFLERGEGRKRERNINAWEIYRSIASRVPPTGHLACNPGMCPDWESNQRFFGCQASTQSTEPHQPRLVLSFVRTLSNCLPKWIYQFTFWPAINERSYSSTSLPVFDFVNVLDFDHSYTYLVLEFAFSWCHMICSIFHMLSCYLYIFC